MISATMAYYDLTFNVIGAIMAQYDLTFNVIGATVAYYNLTFNMIGATVESPLQNPHLFAYINEEFVAVKRSCVDGTSVVFDCLLLVSDCLSLTEGLGWQTAGSPLLGTPRLCRGKFHCLSLSAERSPQAAMEQGGGKGE